jgi:lactoylglutathione lyase
VKLTAPDYVILIVEDLDRALQFYTGVLGLNLGHRSGDYAQLDTGVTRLALYTRSAMAKTLGMSLEMPRSNAPGFEIGFKVADVDAAVDELVARGASLAVPPTDRFWGQRTAYVRDPDGHLIELAQDLGRSKISP